jgi:osmotically-inducible protein OsmY
MMSDQRVPDPQEMSQEDRALAAKVDRLLREEADVYAAVRAENGTIYLDGVVAAAAQRDAATDLAMRVDGVTEVENDLEIEELGQPGAPRLDEMVRADVGYQMLEADLARNPNPLQELA